MLIMSNIRHIKLIVLLVFDVVFISVILIYFNMENGINIHIGWEWALGIIGVLLVLAWRGGGRFSTIEESIEWMKKDLSWVKDILRELKISNDNSDNFVFESQSPVNLNSTGETWLTESGLKEYIDTNKDIFIKICKDKKHSNPYEIQQFVFNLFDTYEFPKEMDDRLKKFAFEKGKSINIVRRVGGIYMRNLCIDEFGMKKDDIDKHDPEKKKL